jgi:ATP/maltotriose-dependent transcriptional regulator MalT
LPAEIAGQRYRLMYIQGLSGLLEGDMEKAGNSLEASLGLLQIMEDPVTHGQVLVGLASLAFIHADFARCSELLHQAEPFHKGIRERIDFLMLRASVALFCESDLLQAGQDLNEAVELVQASDDPRLWFRFSLYLAPEFTVMPGTMSLLEQFCEQAQHWYRHQVAPLRLGVEDTWANIHLRRGRLQTAIEMGKDALWVKEQLGGYTFLGMNASLAVMNAYAALGNYPAAGDYLERTLQQVREAELNQALAGDGLYLLGKIRWLEGRYDEARQVLQQMAALQVRLPLVETLQKMLAGLLEISAQRYSQAETCLVEAVRLQSREYVSEFYGSARLQLAYLYFRWDKTREALDQLEAVMARCEQRLTPGVILQEMPLTAPLLRLAVKKGVRARQATALLDQMGLGLEEEVREEAMLTERQMEILRLIEAGYSNQAIADQLTLSLATVKSHVVHIMNRLGVSSRMEAVACARKMGLLK